jgi:hypothetical protein
MICRNSFALAQSSEKMPKGSFLFCMTDRLMRMATYIWVSLAICLTLLKNLCYTGHALNKIIKDIINRYHVSLGHRVQYVIGI